MKKNYVIGSARKPALIEVGYEEAQVPLPLGSGDLRSQPDGGDGRIEGIQPVAQLVRCQIALEFTSSASDAKSSTKSASPQPNHEPVNRPLTVHWIDLPQCVQADGWMCKPGRVTSQHNFLVPERLGIREVGHSAILIHRPTGYSTGASVPPPLRSWPTSRHGRTEFRSRSPR